ncbi:hypothetical protein [Tuberibacillus sp. Marseille-P3662]|uniref:hypothetical protein n=1 Tax=Tuberibacillus sp. Marseille-P3662 TaxID=1965358 RepID=UPI000A1CA072|nr:hypothetical protein [Tuberibacillus sp. Marseille-P3662]
MLTVVYGGLDGIGFTLTQYLLEQEVTLAAISTGMNEDEKMEDEENEMACGRHALFQPIYSQEAFSDDTDVSDLYVICERLYRNADTSKRLQHIEQWLETVMSAASQTIKHLVVLSHLDIYGDAVGDVDEQTAVHPSTEQGHNADKLEQMVIRQVLKYRQQTPVEQVNIMRLPDVSYNSTTYDPGSDREKVISTLYQAGTNDHLSGGIHIFNVSDHQVYQNSAGEKVRFLNQKVQSFFISPKKDG